MIRCLFVVLIACGSIMAQEMNRTPGADSITVLKRYLVAEYSYQGKSIMPLEFDSVAGFREFLANNPDQESNLKWSRGIAYTTAGLNFIGWGIFAEEGVRYLLTGHASKALLISAVVITVPVTLLNVLWSNKNELKAVDAFNASRRKAPSDR